MGAGLPLDLPMPPIDADFIPPFGPAQHAAEPYLGPGLINGPPGGRQLGRGNGFSPFNSKSQWFFDNGASHHMTPCWEYLHDYKPDAAPAAHVTGIASQSLVRAGTGTLRYTAIVCGTPVQMEIHNVWHVPGMPVSLLSGQALHRDGLWATQGGPDDPTIYVINRNGQCVLECPHTGIEGTLNIPSFKPSVNYSNISQWAIQRFPYHQVVNPRLEAVFHTWAVPPTRR